MDTGDMLRAAREQAGLTQVQVAQRAGVHHSMVSAYELGKRRPGVATFERLLAAAGSHLCAEIAPLDAYLDSRIERALAVSPKARIGMLRGTIDHLLELCEGVPFAVDGLAAAALHGAPVEVTEPAVLLVDDPDFLQTVGARMTSDRVWLDDVGGYRLVAFNAKALSLLDPSRWRTCFGSHFTVKLCPADHFDRVGTVPYGRYALPTVGMWELELADPAVAAVLVRTREILAARPELAAQEWVDEPAPVPQPSVRAAATIAEAISATSSGPVTYGGIV